MGFGLLFVGCLGLCVLVTWVGEMGALLGFY